MNRINGIDFDNAIFQDNYLALVQEYTDIVNQGGTYSGKTFDSVLAHFQFAIDYKFKELVTCMAPTFPQVRAGILKDFLTIIEAFPDYVKSIKKDSIYKVANTTFEFVSIDNPSKARAGKRERCILDECNLIDFETVRLIMGKSSKSSTINYNPYSKFWFHTKVLPYANLDKLLFKRTTYKDNIENLSSKTIDWIESLAISDPETYRVLGEGKLGTGKGLVFPKINIVTQMPKGVRRAFGLDLGYTNDPTALIEACIYQGEIYLKEIVYGKGIKRKELEKAMRLYGITEQDIIVCDSDHTMIDELISSGFLVIKSKKRSVELGIDQMKQYSINIFHTSVNMLREQQIYRYDIKDDEVLNSIPLLQDYKRLLKDVRHYFLYIFLNNLPGLS